MQREIRVNKKNKHRSLSSLIHLKKPKGRKEGFVDFHCEHRFAASVEFVVLPIRNAIVVKEAVNFP